MFHKGKIFLLNKYQSVMDWERQTSYEITYMWNLKKRLQMNFSTKQKQSYRYRKQFYGFCAGMRGQEWREG